MMKLAALALIGSASAFAPAAVQQRSSSALRAERSVSMPFMNAQPLVGRRCRSLLLAGLCRGVLSPVLYGCF
jgi:hypothetical protein